MEPANVLKERADYMSEVNSSQMGNWAGCADKHSI